MWLVLMAEIHRHTLSTLTSLFPSTAAIIKRAWSAHAKHILTSQRVMVSVYSNSRLNSTMSQRKQKKK